MAIEDFELRQVVEQMNRAVKNNTVKELITRYADMLKRQDISQDHRRIYAAAIVQLKGP